MPTNAPRTVILNDYVYRGVPYQYTRPDGTVVDLTRPGDVPTQAQIDSDNGTITPPAGYSPVFDGTRWVNTILRPGSAMPLFFDDFKRANTPNGSVGLPSQGAPYQPMLGPAGVVGASVARINNYRLVTDPGDVMYLTQYLPNYACNQIGCTASWTAGNGGASPGTIALLLGPAGGGTALFQNALHITITRFQLQVGRIIGGTFPTPELIYNFPTPLAADGTVYSFDFTRYNNIVNCITAGYYNRMVIPTYPQPAVSGPYCTWEIFYQTASVSDTLRLESVWADIVKPPAPTLRDLVTSAWKYNASLADATNRGNGPLVAVNAPTLAAGKIGQAATFVSASSQEYTVASTSDLTLAGKDYTVVTWVKPTTLPSQVIPLISKGSATLTDWLIYIDGTNGNMTSWVSSDGSMGGSASRSVTPSPAFATGVWRMVYGIYDSVNTSLYAGVDLLRSSASPSIAPFAGVRSSTDPLHVGRWPFGGVYLNGSLGPTMIFSSLPGEGGVLTPLQIAQLYSDSDGITYPF